MSEQSPSPAGTVNPEVARKNRRLLLILLATFVIPFVIGDFAYKQGWYKGGQTNKGQLIQPPVAFAGFKAVDASGKTLDASFAKGKWWLLYVVPADCGIACRNRLFQMRQVPRALGKEAERVRQLLVTTSPLSAETEALIAREFPEFVRIQAQATSVDAALASAASAASQAGQLYLMDPMGWLMLDYAPEPDEKASVIKAEDILKDLQKLLKNSRIG
jgi:cytochrome oxidase Cu insertion factor (SCO1/SenC/PrrC family)